MYIGVTIKQNNMDKTIYKFGFWSGIIASAATIAFVAVQLLQVTGNLLFPLDEILIYGISLCIVIPFLIQMLSLHYAAAHKKKFWSHGALIFTIIYAVFVTTNYVVQLATVIPMKLNGAGDKVLILEQTPHSLFWDLDGIGYFFMGLATLMAVPVFEKHGFEKWVRISFLANALVTPLIMFVYFYRPYSERLLFIAFPWAITAPLAMLMLALLFKKNKEYKNEQVENRWF